MHVALERFHLHPQEATWPTKEVGALKFLFLFRSQGTSMGMSSSSLVAEHAAGLDQGIAREHVCVSPVRPFLHLRCSASPRGRLAANCLRLGSQW